MKRIIRVVTGSFIVSFFVGVSLVLLPGLSGALPAIRPLNHRVLDAEYSKALDRIVTISATPKNQLHIVHPVTAESVDIDLPLSPACVSVSPDGLFAAVGHNGWISYVNLSTHALVKTLPVTADVLDIVLGGNGWVYALPRSYYGGVIRSINLESGQEVSGTGIMDSGTAAKLHPGGKAIYSVTDYTLEKYDISQGQAAFLDDSWDHGDFQMCGNLWISEDGLRIFTRCGKLFRSSESEAEDMLYNGSLQDDGWIVDLAHSASTHRVIVIHGVRYDQSTTQDTEIWIYDEAYLAFQSKMKIPSLVANGREYASHGKYAFFSADGNSYSIIVQTDPSSGMLLDFGIFTIGPDSERHALHASAGSGGMITPSGDLQVVEGTMMPFTVIPDPGYDVADVLMDGASVGKVLSYAFENITANHTINASFTRLPSQAILPLNHRVLDAEYSKQLDRIISISATPAKRLHVIDPLSGASLAVDLPLTPTSVSVGPDGLHAAVGHDGYISYIDLATPALVKILRVSTDVFDVVLAGNGWIYVFPAYDQLEVTTCVNVETGREVLSTGMRIEAGMRAKLHPGGSAIYGADDYHLAKYDITQGQAAYLYATYDWNHSTCGNLWISEDGLRLFTGCGNVFRSSESTAEDMHYNGSLEKIGVTADVSHSAAANKVIAIPGKDYTYPPHDRDTEVWKFDYDSLILESKVIIPDFCGSGQSYKGHGRFVFFSADGSKYSVLVQADANSGILLDYGIFTIGTDAKQLFIDATAGPGGTITPVDHVMVSEGTSLTFTITPNPGYDIADVLVDGVSVGKVGSYTFEDITANHTIDASFGFGGMEYFGMEIGNYQEMVIPGNEEAPPLRLEVAYIDGEYSEPTVVMEERVQGSLKGRYWYQALPGALGTIKGESDGYTTEFSSPLLILREPLIEGDHWETSTTANASGTILDAKLEVTVGKRKMISVPAGMFLAYPVKYHMIYSRGRAHSSNAWTEWFVPYIGTIKSSGSRWVLGSFAIRGGSVTSPPPIITGINPSLAGVGDRISLTGYSFANSQKAVGVTINGVDATQVLSWSDTQIDLIVPPGVSSGPVVVTTSEWESNGTVILYLKESPQITSVSPSIARPGEVVTIQGKNLGAHAGKVTIGGLNAKVVQGGWTYEEIVCKVPKKLPPGTYDVSVKTKFGIDTLLGGFTLPE